MQRATSFGAMVSMLLRRGGLVPLVLGLLFFASLRQGGAARPLAPSAAGDLDLAFGSSGEVRTDIREIDQFFAGAIQADGKIVAGGAASDGSRDFALARYRADGTLDPAFGGAGIVETDIGGNEDAINALAVQTDGKIVVAGISAIPTGGNQFALARYLSSGALDSTFGGGDGIALVTPAPPNGALALAIQSDGKLVIAGGSGLGFDVLRFESDGDLDPTFGQKGRARTAFNGQGALAQSVVIQGDGKLVVGGFTIGTLDETPVDLALARYNADGTPDATFGTAGTVTTDLSASDKLNDLALQADGKIVAVGHLSPEVPYEDFLVARYTAAGALDTGFGSGLGYTTARFATFQTAEAVALQDDGKIVTLGWTNFGSQLEQNRFNFAVTRHDATGALDPTWDDDGKTFTQFDANDRGFDVAIQADRKVVVIGYSQEDRATQDAPADGVLARYFNDGQEVTPTATITRIPSRTATPTATPLPFGPRLWLPIVRR